MTTKKAFVLAGIHGSFVVSEGRLTHDKPVPEYLRTVRMLRVERVAAPIEDGERDVMFYAFDHEMLKLAAKRIAMVCDGVESGDYNEDVHVTTERVYTRLCELAGMTPVYPVRLTLC
jgi:hypothetical protein